MNYTADKYKGAWGIYCNTSRCWVMFGEKQIMEKRVKELNNEESKPIQKASTTGC